MFIFEREIERERQSISREGAETDRDTESEAGSRLELPAQSLMLGLEPTSHEIMT